MYDPAVSYKFSMKAKPAVWHYVLVSRSDRYPDSVILAVSNRVYVAPQAGVPIGSKAVCSLGPREM